MNKPKADLIASIAAGAREPADPAPSSTRKAQSASRDGKSFIGGYFPPEVARQVRILAAEQGTTIQLLTAEALNHLFAAYGKPQIASSGEQSPRKHVGM